MTRNTDIPATHTGHAAPLGQLDLRFGSNAVRLSARQWAVAGAVLLAVFTLTPRLWPRTEGLPLGPDGRMPYDLSNDYWLFDRYARRATAENNAAVLGDSVIWGQYVTEDQTLTHNLNLAVGGPRFTNLGMDGMHPVALAGLVEYYGSGIAGRRVLLHCNLLWMSSKKHDLQTTKEFRFNHPDLVPQFVPQIPCYTESVSRRLSVVIGRAVPFMGWADHLRLAYFEQKDVAAWSLDHPYVDPLAVIARGRPPDEDRLRHEPLAWTARGIEPQAFAWVDLATSLQWRFFRQTVETLRHRGNRVFVLVGPFNEHLLTTESREVYGRRKAEVETWLRAEGVPHAAPDVLPSEEYADASHPLSAGYARLARRLWEDPAFATWARPPSNTGDQHADGPGGH